MSSKKSAKKGRKSPNRSGAAAQKSAAQRAVAQARTSQRRNTMLFTGGAVVVVIVLIAAIVFAVARSSKDKANDAAQTDINNPPAVTATGGTNPPPWPAPGNATDRVRAAGLPMLGTEGSVEHIHAHLDVLVDGKPVQVPALIGIDASSQQLSPVHTHKPTGIIHMESPVKRQFSLGEFFTEWNVSLGQDNVGGLHNADGKTLRWFVNGKQQTGNPAAFMFHDRDEIALVYGTPQPGEKIPSSYDFSVEGL